MMNETIEKINTLRSVHGGFSESSISDENMDLILDCLVRAANASGRQNYSVVMVSEKEKMINLCGYAGDRLLVFCVDYTRIIDVAAYLGYEYHVPDITAFITGSIDTVLAAQTACIAAKSLGIDSLFTNGIHRGDISRVYKILKLPEKYCFPLIALVLGYAQDQAGAKKGRLTGAGVFHEENYSRITEDEKKQIIAKYDDPELNIGLNMEWQKEGMSHYLDWFFSKWSRKTDTKHISSILENAGFLPKNPCLFRDNQKQ